MLKFDDAKQKQRLDDLRSSEAEGLAQALAAKYSLPYIDLTKYAINTDALRLIPEAEAQAAEMAAFKLTGQQLFVVVRAPANPKTEAILVGLKDKDYRLEIYLGSEASLKRAWEYYEE